MIRATPAWRRMHTPRVCGLGPKQLRYILDPHGLSERELEDILDPWEDPTCSGPHLLPAERGETVEGLIISHKSDDRIRYALKHTSNVGLKLYEVDFDLVAPDDGGEAG